MRLLLVATLPILFCVGTNAAPRSYSGSGSDADNAGQDAGVVYLPAENLRNELLNSTGLAPDSLIAVATSYEAVKDESPGLAGVATANSNVAASVLIIPTKDRVGTMTETSEITSDELSGRTQVMYNCTSAANLWNLQDDPNALKLENFQQLSNNASNDSTTPQETELREIVAIASVEFSNCATVWETAVGRPVVGNTFFSAEFSNNPVYFYTVSSSEPYTSDAGGCLLQLEMSWANLTEVYPNCKVYVQSTDLDNIIHSNATASGAEGSKNRRLEMGTYNFVRDPLCTYECGAGRAEPDECLVDLGNGEYDILECRIQFYEQNPNCNNECGDQVGDLLISADKCFKCKLSLSCDSGYSPDWYTCCTLFTCNPVKDTTVNTPVGLTWNLESDGTIINPSYVLYQGGDCSNVYDQSSTCCRITCENCFVSLSLASFYADVDVNGLTDYSTTAEMKLAGGSVQVVKIFAPSGCKFESTKNIVDKSASISLGYGISVKLNMKLDILERLNIKPHGTSVEFGAYTDITGITTGYIDSEQFFDVEMNTTPISNLEQSGIDIEAELSAIPTISATISLIAGVAKVGIKTSCAIFTMLKTGIRYPVLYPALQSRYLDPKSMAHIGNCNLPHFMEFNIYVGFKDFNVSLPMEFSVGSLFSKSFEPKKNANISISKSLFSGCIATAYDAQILLSTALATVSSLSADKQKMLKKVLMWALNITDIDPDYLSINSISASTGEISVLITVPPSVAEDYPTALKFQEVIYQRARTKVFSDAVSAFVGLEMNAQCNIGSWGATCGSACDLGNCSIAKCNPVDGITTSCSSCKDGYWGPTCGKACTLLGHCSKTKCSPVDGSSTLCLLCEDGYWGSACETPCDLGHCSKGKCGPVDGAIISCSSCEEGYWGSTCGKTCDLNHCTKAKCNPGNGATVSCSSCEAGYWGSTCEKQCVLGHCIDATCNSVDGVTTSCSTCENGYWGLTCQERCDLPLHCNSGWCPQFSAGATLCTSCDDGWNGDLCRTSTTTTASTGDQTSAACTRTAQKTLLWAAVYIFTFGLLSLL